MLSEHFKRSEVKESMILLLFALLLNETLTNMTIFFVSFGAILAWVRYRPSSIIRNIITLAIFVSYWIVYGKVIDPEVGLNFLTIIIVIKLLEKESQRDRYMVMFGIILLVSSGTLFQRNIIYVIFFILSLFILLQDFYIYLKLSFKVSDIGKLFLWILPITLLLFFFAPRVMNPLPMAGPMLSKGEVGYSPEVQISEVESVTLNNSLVFSAEVDRRLSQEQLYWRGNTLSFTDGWNWPLMARDKHFSPLHSIKIKESGQVQKIRILNKQDFLFTLDTPLQVIVPAGEFAFDDTRTISLMERSWYPYYTVYSEINLEKFAAPKSVDRVYLLSSLKKEEKQWVRDNFHSQNYPELEAEIKKYFRINQFRYSLSPGKTPSFLSFMRDKKSGFCSHYASAVALLLREKGIAARLVSGFMGGEFNEFATYYNIGQSDAHVWVEVHHQGFWKRIDPTGWIAPERLVLGGEAFIAQLDQGTFSRIKYSQALRWVIQARKWFDQWDYKFYQWLEKMDYHGQEKFFLKLNLKRKWLFTILPILISIFSFVYWLVINNKKRPQNEIEILWKIYLNKLSMRKIIINLFSIQLGREQILKSSDPAKEKILHIWDQLILITFSTSSIEKLKDLKKKINSL